MITKKDLKKRAALAEIRSNFISSIPKKFFLKKDDAGNFVLPKNSTVFNEAKKFLLKKDNHFASLHPSYIFLVRSRIATLHRLDHNIFPENSKIRKILES